MSINELLASTQDARRIFGFGIAERFTIARSSSAALFPLWA